ncbi:hypothetical protein BDW69DRAFT_187473 [Aspergillus filifer]
MLSVLREFGVHPNAFHHALEAWQVPELLKHLKPNITIAIFADNALYKAEACDANLRAPKILNDHGVNVVLKSDHTGEGNYAKFLLDQASIAHSFGLPADKALQSVTSIHANSIAQGHRVGYICSGYDADLVIWDDHPLQVGATAVEVFIDGRPLLAKNLQIWIRNDICSSIRDPVGPIVFTGIQQVLIDHPGLESEERNLVLVTENNRVSCLGSRNTCLSQYRTVANITKVPLQNGYITPGLIAFGNNIGIQDIPSEPSTGDGVAGRTGDLLNEAKTVHFAKYGVHLHGKAFDRARIGGVMRAISPPHGSGVVQGVSVGVYTGSDETILGGGIWKEDVVLHFSVGDGAKDDTPTVGSGIEAIQAASKASTAIPTQSSEWVAEPVAEANISVILTGNRGAPDTWEKKDTLPGPPLSEIPAKVLLDAGVQVGLAVRDNSALHALAREARWAGKFAGLSDKEAIGLVSINIERILGLTNVAGVDADQDGYPGDSVVWEGNPLRGGGSVAVFLTRDGRIGDCWPDDDGSV